MLVALAEVALGDGDLALRAVAKLDACVPTGKIRTYQFFPVLDVFGNDKVSRLCCCVGMKEEMIRLSKSAMHQNS